MASVTMRQLSWRGYEGLQLESQQVSLIVVPAAGARIVSLVDKRVGFEWLVTPEQSNPFRVFAPNTEYNPNQAGGWDEMFPTILACGYPAPGAWHGIPLPDHGEAWTAAWADGGTSDGNIRLTLEGQALPYRLARSLSFPDPSIILFTYDLHNLGAEPLAYLWSPHPQFACEPGARILLPADVTEVINVLPLEWGPEWGPAGTRNPWPVKELPGGALARQDVVASPERKGGRKFYLPPERPIAWAGLQQPKLGCELHMEWDAKSLPYCGVWIDEGFLNKVADVAIEPTTAYYDNLATGWTNHRVAVLPPGETCTWQLLVRLGAEA